MRRPDVLTYTLRLVNSEWQDIDGTASKFANLTLIARVKEKTPIEVQRCGTSLFNFDREALKRTGIDEYYCPS